MRKTSELRSPVPKIWKPSYRFVKLTVFCASGRNRSPSIVADISIVLSRSIINYSRYDLIELVTNRWFSNFRFFLSPSFKRDSLPFYHFNSSFVQFYLKSLSLYTSSLHRFFDRRNPLNRISNNQTHFQIQFPFSTLGLNRMDSFAIPSHYGALIHVKIQLCATEEIVQTWTSLGHNGENRESPEFLGYIYRIFFPYVPKHTIFPRV